MTYLLIGDLHLSDRPRDTYRFNIFPWILQQQDKYKPVATFLAGDITDSKDNHSAGLVNRIVQSLMMLQDPVYVLKGNHDYIDPANPFFGFLNYLAGVSFVSEPQLAYEVGLLPHCNSEAQFETAYKRLAGRKPRLILLHNTIEGSIAETGAHLSGFRASVVGPFVPRLGVYGGDVHRPQVAGPVTYVGAPYQIRFGDDFEPRCLLLSDFAQKELHFDTVRKWQLTIHEARQITDNKALFKGDQVKITVELPPEESVHWQTNRRQVLEAAGKKGLEVFGVALKLNTSIRKAAILKHKASAAPAEVLNSYCKHESVPALMRDVGREILECD